MGLTQKHWSSSVHGRSLEPGEYLPPTSHVCVGLHLTWTQQTAGIMCLSPWLEPASATQCFFQCLVCSQLWKLLECLLAKRSGQLHQKLPLYCSEYQKTDQSKWKQKITEGQKCFICIQMLCTSLTLIQFFCWFIPTSHLSTQAQALWLQVLLLAMLLPSQYSP